ncbi:MAG TPA: DUF4386 domain-containing protein [Candidatus Dormibacteraeota bacterium]|nr:DUF4386 domain-containing protein [Candidatus Dormibacteraeota bacterium]
MTDTGAKTSPRPRARIAGVFYLLTFVTGAFAASVSGRLAVYGDAANIIASACYVVVTLLFYGLFKPVDNTLSLIAAVFGLVGCAMGALGVFHLVPPPISSINPLVLFGVYCLIIGYLVFRSTFLPRFLGVLMAIGGLGWLTFLSSTLANSLSPYNLAPGMLGEGALTVWLLVVGVNVRRWQEQASVTG